MERSWTFGQKVGAGFGAMVALALLTTTGAVYGLRNVTASKDRVISGDARNVILAGNARIGIEWKSSSLRQFLLVRDESVLATNRQARQDYFEALRSLRAQGLDPEALRILDNVERLEAAHQAGSEQLIALRRGEASAEVAGRVFEQRVLPIMNDLRQQIAAFTRLQERRLERGSREATAASEKTTSALLATALVALAVAIALALVLTRALSRQISSAVQHIRTSSTELQTAASQQATGTRELSTALAEIATTINELLATSRQIAESAQRVAHISEDTARAARTGETTVGRTGDSITAIKKQVDLIVTHMLNLGKKSQQIGGILEIINELAEQTNILAINATIEAAGAGEAGKRFAVVADEIRRLADRVGGSTKEIRGLIDEIRGAVNTTVMTTEGGSKAVDAGARQFAEVATALQQIVGAVGTTSEAAREIELSTKQQATAVEQVNVAIANISTATRETETSATQTLQTASQLTDLSRDLMRLVQPQAAS